MRHPWDKSFVVERRSERQKWVIAGKQLVTAITRKRHRHVLAGKPAKKIGRQNRRIPKRLIEPREHQRDEITGGREIQMLQLEIAADSLRHLAGKRGLVE